MNPNSRFTILTEYPSFAQIAEMDLPDWQRRQFHWFRLISRLAVQDCRHFKQNIERQIDESMNSWEDYWAEQLYPEEFAEAQASERAFLLF